METNTVTWEAKDQRCCVIISIKGKSYQVALDKSQQKSVAFILPQLFPDHKIKILPEELPITLPIL